MIGLCLPPCRPGPCRPVPRGRRPGAAAAGPGPGPGSAMRIVRVANYVAPASGGLRTALRELGAGYLAAGHEPVLVIPGPQPGRRLTRQGLVITVPGAPVPGTGGYRAIVTRRPLRRLLEGLEPGRLEVSDRTTLRWTGRWAASRGIRSMMVSHDSVAALAAMFAPPGLGTDWLADLANRDTAASYDVVVCTTAWAAAEFRRLPPATWCRCRSASIWPGSTRGTRTASCGPGWPGRASRCWCTAAGCPRRSARNAPSARWPSCTAAACPRCWWWRATGRGCARCAPRRVACRCASSGTWRTGGCWPACWPPRTWPSRPGRPRRSGCPRWRRWPAGRRWWSASAAPCPRWWAAPDWPSRTPTPLTPTPSSACSPGIRPGAGAGPGTGPGGSAGPRRCADSWPRTDCPPRRMCWRRRAGAGRGGGAP